jgi:PKD repeat protein
MKSRILKRSPCSVVAVLVIIFTVLSCGRLPKPDFTYSPKDNPEAGDTIWFSNESSISERFEWKFGDGGISNQSNPIYIYKEAGIYEIKLTAFNESGENFITESVSIREPTILGLISYDSTGLNPLSGTTIWVYDNERDRDSLYTPLYSGTTDSEGNVEFRNVDAKVYHVWAIKEEAAGKWTFRGYTAPLRQNKVNRFTFPCTWNDTVTL